jgi:hypothetical protein
MTPEHLPPDAIFIRWGKFEAGAFGRPAIVAFIVLVMAAFGAWFAGII